MITEVAHQIGIIPILVMVGVGRRLPSSYWFVAVAWFVSWLADSASYFVSGAWWIDYVWIPLQVWLVLQAFVSRPSNRLFSAVALLLLAPVSWAFSGPGPDLLISFIGSVAILWIARGRLAVPLYIYFGLGTLAYLVMVLQIGGDAMPAWKAYQLCRLLAYISFIVIIAPPLIKRKRGTI